MAPFFESLPKTNQAVFGSSIDLGHPRQAVAGLQRPPSPSCIVLEEPRRLVRWEEQERYRQRIP